MGAINKGRKDHGFGLGMIGDGSKQLFRIPGGKNEIEENVEVDSTGGEKRGTNEWR